MKKVVSIALFGPGNGYAQYSASWMKAHLNLFPIADGWMLRAHLGIDIDEKWKKFYVSLAGRGLIEIEWMEHAALTAAMLWRVRPVFDPAVDYVFCRDLDALPMPRDRRACEEFIRSECDFGSIHDNLQHFATLGGLCHFRTKTFREVMKLDSMDALIRAAGNRNWLVKGCDQIVLNELVLRNPDIKFLEHRFNGWTNADPGPHRREAGSYACQSWSTPLADAGMAVMGPVTDLADRLANHLGAAGYDHEFASKFYDKYGDREISAAVQEAEAA